MSNEPFGHQPQPVRVTIEGESPDIDYWVGRLIAAAEFKGDSTQRHRQDVVGSRVFTIYPRAVND